jgi:hypothetical protein
MKGKIKLPFIKEGEFVDHFSYFVPELPKIRTFLDHI